MCAPSVQGGHMGPPLQGICRQAVVRASVPAAALRSTTNYPRARFYPAWKKARKALKVM